MTTPLILTPGEPGGVGSEISAKAWMAAREENAMAFSLLTDIDHLRSSLRMAGINVPVQKIAALSEAPGVFANALPVLHRPLPSPAALGTFFASTAVWVTSCIEEAVNLCLAGKAAGMITNPIQKEALYAAGFSFQGHTDYLASLARKQGHAAHDVMMLVGEGLRAVPVTVHIALKDVPAKLTQMEIMTQARIVHDALARFFGIVSPRIAVTGLNPHAGENGSMGREEIDVIIPAIKALQVEGFNIKGPLPADTAFFPAARAQYDAILCMYHDQALIPVKTLDFHGGVNVTLGLPFIRTSPDHGTALSLAGTGQAQHHSLLAAFRLARQMVQNRK